MFILLAVHIILLMLFASISDDAKISGLWFYLIAFKNTILFCSGVLALVAIMAAFIGRLKKVKTLLCFFSFAALIVSTFVFAPHIFNFYKTYSAEEISQNLNIDKLHILSWNIQNTDYDNLIEIASVLRPDIIVLPETRDINAQTIVSSLSQYGINMSYFASKGENITYEISVLISTDLISKGAKQTLDSGFNIIKTQEFNIVAVHLNHITFGDKDSWLSQIQKINSYCLDSKTVVVGDFNASGDHISSRLNNCLTFEASTKGGAAATWPSILPAFMGSQIDTAYISSDLDISGFWVLNTSSDISDHRAVFLELGTK